MIISKVEYYQSYYTSDEHEAEKIWIMVKGHEGIQMTHI